MDSIIGTMWAAKDGSRTVAVITELSEFRLERQFRIRNQQTGRDSQISASGLHRKFRQIADS